jgi:thermitase
MISFLHARRTALRTVPAPSTAVAALAAAACAGAAGLVVAGPAAAEQRIIVGYEAGVPSGERAVARGATGVRLVERLRVPRAEVVSVADGAAERVLAELDNRADVRFAEIDVPMEADALPNDPLLPSQWGLRNAFTGNAYPFGTFRFRTPQQASVAGADLDLAGARELQADAAGVVVGVVDDGIDERHPDIAANIWTNPGEVAGNGVDDDANGLVDDVHGYDFVRGTATSGIEAEHGTHVAGVLGAVGDNGIGISGVAGRTRIINARGIPGDGPVGLASQTSQAADYAAKQGARVVNMSIGSECPSQLLYDVLRSHPNTVFVVTAGNEGGDNDVVDPTNTALCGSAAQKAPGRYPCNFGPGPDPAISGRDGFPGQTLANVICVANSRPDDRKALGSNYGLTAVDLAAPGTEILSLAPSYGTLGEWGFEPGEDLAPLVLGNWGTSTAAAAPVGSGVAVDRPNGTAQPAGSARSITVPVDLSGRRGCDLAFLLRLDLDGAGDTFDVQASTDGGAFTSLLDTPLSRDRLQFEPQRIDLNSLDGQANVVLRLRSLLDSDARNDTGAAIDDLQLVCPDGNVADAATDYRYTTGTSQASPAVAGAVALMLARNPQLTPAAVRQALRSSVDPLAAFATSVPGDDTGTQRDAGPTASGGRLDVRQALLVPPPAPPPTPPPTPTPTPPPPPRPRPRTPAEIFDLRCLSPTAASRRVPRIRLYGLAIQVTLAQPAVLDARIVVGPKVARSLGLGSRAVTLATGARRRPTAKATLRLRVAAKYLRRLQRRPTTAVTLRVTASDGTVIQRVELALTLRR